MQYYMQKIVNRVFNMRKLLLAYDSSIYLTDVVTTFCCPFPNHGGPDERKSAKYYADTNEVFCFAERKTYRPYDVLKLMGRSDDDIMAFIRPKLSTGLLQGLQPQERRVRPIPAGLLAAAKSFKMGGKFEVFQAQLKLFLNLEDS